LSEGQTERKDQLLREIDRGWADLVAFLDQAGEEALTGPVDAEGWTVKDHVVHLAAWERSALFLLQGRPRHEGLGVSEATYLSNTDGEKAWDAINAAIKQNASLSLSEALADLHQTHEYLLEALQPLTDEELELPYAHYLPDEPGEGAGPPAFGVVSGNSWEHYVEHLEWMRAILAGNGER
jgi:hypothetical protein